MTLRDRDRFVSITVPLGADVVEWLDGRIREGDVRAVEQLGALIGARLVQEALDAARDVQRDRARDSDPGPEAAE